VGKFLYFKIPHLKCSFLDFGRDQDGAADLATFHFLENEQKWWGNFIYENFPTFFCGFQALIRSDFRGIAFFAGSMPDKRWNLGGEISLFQNTPPKMLIPGFRPGSGRRARLILGFRPGSGRRARLIPGFRPGRSGFSEPEQGCDAGFCIDSAGVGTVLGASQPSIFWRMSKNGGVISYIQISPPFLLGCRHRSGRIIGKSRFSPDQCPINVGNWVEKFLYFKIPHPKMRIPVSAAPDRNPPRARVSGLRSDRQFSDRCKKKK
jgi:hypothetical protein